MVVLVLVLVVLVLDDVIVDEVVDELVVVGVVVEVEGRTDVVVFPQSLFAAWARRSFGWDAT